MADTADHVLQIIDLNDIVGEDDLKIIEETREGAPVPAVRVDLTDLAPPGELTIISEELLTEASFKYERPEARAARIERENLDAAHQRQLEVMLVKFSMLLVSIVVAVCVWQVSNYGPTGAPWATGILGAIAVLIAALVRYMPGRGVPK